MSRRLSDERIRAATRPLASTTRSIRFAALATALAVLAIAAPSNAFGAAKGIETDITWGVDSGTQTTDANDMVDLGTNWTRMVLSWHDVETSKGTYSNQKLAEIDAAVSLARARGINVDMDVVESPQWASGSADKNAPPQNPQDYANFVWAMAKRYAGQVAAWEVWNEENTPMFWGGTTNAGAYAQLLKLAQGAVKSADPNALVVFGGMSTNDWQWLESVYSAAPDIGNYFDVMATHPYTPQAAPDVVNFDDAAHISRLSFAGYKTIHNVMLEHGNDKPIWFTEMGWATTSQAGWGVNAQQQADYTKQAWACMQQDPYVQVGFLYELRNNYWANNADDWSDQLGITNVDWSPKPAYDAFKSVDPNAGGCTYHEPDGAGITSDGHKIMPATPTTASGNSAAGSGSGSGSSRTASRRQAKPKISLHVLSVGGHSAGASKRLETGVAFKILGRVRNAFGGSVLLTLQHRVQGTWRNADKIRVAVTKSGAFSTNRLKALSKGGWRVRGAYSTKARSSFVYFKA